MVHIMSAPMSANRRGAALAVLLMIGPLCGSLCEPARGEDTSNLLATAASLEDEDAALPLSVKVSTIPRALNWIVRHQNADGSWSLDKFSARCRNPDCKGAGNAHSDVAATALGLLPLLAAGNLSPNQGAYAKQTRAGVDWLVARQKPNGALAAGLASEMYSHALATWTLCEAFALSGDKALSQPAQRGVEFIEAAQNKTTGGWRYQPGDSGDTSIFGWQLVALESAQQAGLKVQPETLERAQLWLKSVAAGEGGRFSYLPGGVPTPTMAAIGLDALRYLHQAADTPATREATAQLMASVPAMEARNAYYWFFATLGLRHSPDANRDAWTRQLRELLITTQCHEENSCSFGSWDPAQPSQDAWGQIGGRLMITSLSCLALQIDDHVLSLYKLKK